MKIQAQVLFASLLIMGNQSEAARREPGAARSVKLASVASVASGTDVADAKAIESGASATAAGVTESPVNTYVKPGAVSGGSTESIRIQLMGEPSSLDPAHLIDQYGLSIMRNVIQGLFKLDAQGKLVNGLVETYEISADGLSYRFKLKKNAKWSDGRAVTIEDFVFGLRRTVDPKVACADADSFLAIVNAREIFYGRAPVDSLGVKRVGNELRIQLIRPDPAFLLELSMPSAGPIRRDLVEANKGKWSSRHPVTGDYFIASQTREMIELQPNPLFRARGHRPVTFKLVQEGVEALRQLESGELDILTRIPMASVNEMREKGLLKIVPSTTIFYVSFNLSKPPFNRLEWRRAIASVVDRKAIEAKLQGTFHAVTSYLPKELDGALAYAPVANKGAVNLVKKAIIQGKFPKTPIQFAFANSEVSALMAESLKEAFAKELGLEVTLAPTDLKSLLVRLTKDPPEMYLLGKTAYFNDSITHLAAFTNIPDANYSRYRSSEYEQLVNKIRLNPTSAKRIDLARRANITLVNKDVVLVPLMMRSQTFGISPKIKGFKVSPYQVIHLAALRK